jgi:hypothetical protein
MADPVNLTAAFNAQIRKIPGGERFLADPLEVDIGAVAVAVAEAWAADMRENLQAGRRPDGKGPMPRVLVDNYAQRKAQSAASKHEGKDSDDAWDAAFDAASRGPRRKPGTRRRGEGTSTVASISARWSKTLNRLVVAADEPNAGALARILRGIPFRPPVKSARVAAVQGDAVLIATMHGAAATKRGRTWSPGRLAAWRKWQASKR